MVEEKEQVIKVGFGERQAGAERVVGARALVEELAQEEERVGDF